MSKSDKQFLKKLLPVLAALFLLFSLAACGYDEEDIEQAELSGYDHGYSEGYSEGYNDGQADGYDEGYEDGFDDSAAHGTYIQDMRYREIFNYLWGEIGEDEIVDYLNEFSSKNYKPDNGSSAPQELTIIPPSGGQQGPSRSLPAAAPASDAVYVSRNGVIHSDPHCSGMKYYTEMSYSDAVSYGYRLCSKCY